MKTLKFCGFSDDTFGLIGGYDYDNCAQDAPISCAISSDEGALLVVGHYHVHPLDGCWTIGVSMIAEDAPIPPWPVRFTACESGYSPIMEIDVPDDATLKWFSGSNEVKD